MPSFDPKTRVRRLNGNAYLDVKWRLLWFREEWPQGRITSDLIAHDDQSALFRVGVTKVDADGNPHGSAQAYGSETRQDFRDFLEKAETKALGRALIALGFGTEFALAYDDQPDDDVPVETPRPPVKRTSAQTARMVQLRDQLRWPDSRVGDYAREIIGKRFNEATAAEAERVIAALEALVDQADQEQAAQP